MRRIFRFRSLQQKLGFYAFVVSFLAMVTISVLSYQVARDQIREDREQLMGVYAQQIAQELERELRTAQQELQLWGEADFVHASLKSPGGARFGVFFDELIRHQP